MEVIIYFLGISVAITIILVIIKIFKKVYFKRYPKIFNNKFIVSLFVYLILIFLGITSFFISRAEKVEKGSETCFYINEFFQGRPINGNLCLKYFINIEQEKFFHFAILMAIIFLIMIIFRSIKNPESINILLNEKIEIGDIEGQNKIRPWFLIVSVILFLIFAGIIIWWGINA